MLISVDGLVLYVGLGGFMWVVVEAWFGVICGVGWFCVNPPVQFLTNKRIFFKNECVTNWCSKLILYFQYIYFLIIKKICLIGIQRICLELIIGQHWSKLSFAHFKA